MTSSNEQLVPPDSLLDGINWHKPAHRAVLASVKLGSWMSAALDDATVCEAMKADIREWFSAGEPMETLCQALAALAPNALDTGDTQDDDTDAARLDYARAMFTAIIANPAIAVPLAKTGLDFCNLSSVERANMRGDIS